VIKKEIGVLRDVSAGLRIPPDDYVAEGLSIVLLDDLFPNMIVGDKANHPWPYLRREVPHNWYCDRRYPEVGFLNRDEVMLLYNLALQFSGKPGLEIGCWMGWSTCHLALAGLQLDVIDPVLADGEHEASVLHALERAKVSDRVRLFRTRSPQAVEQLARARGGRWNFFFIDGDHVAPAPERDARACLQYAADDALFVFHDLVSPDVEKGLAVLSEAGFKTIIYETMQIVGVAWRGNVTPVPHLPDPAHEWSLPRHLLKYPVAGESPRIRSERMAGLLQIAEREVALRDARIAEVTEAALAARNELALKDAGIAEVTGKVDELDKLVGARDEEIVRLSDEIAKRGRTLSSLENTIARVQVELDRTRAALRESTERSQSLDGRVNELSAALADIKSTSEGLQGRLLRMKRSYSWTLTSPLREIRRAGLRLRRYFQRTMGAPRRGNPWNIVRRFMVLRRSPLMNRSYYKRAYADSTESRLGRFWHYLTVGASELRQPSALFDPKWYLEQNPEVATAGYDPVLHYLKIGWKQRRKPHPLFDVDYYLNSNPDVEKAGLEPLSHYITEGGRQGRNPNPMFDSAWYLSQHAEVADSILNPLEHYVTVGVSKNYDPHPLFDSAFYLLRKPELSMNGANPLADYLAHGPGEAYNPEPLQGLSFDDGVCIVTPDFVGPINNGGIGTACYHYAVALVNSGHKVTVLFSEEISRGQTNHWRRHYAKMGIAFLSLADLPTPSHFVYGDTWFLRRSQRILNFLTDKAFDVVHFQDWKANGFWPIRARRLGYALQNSLLTLTMHSNTKWIGQGMEEFPRDAATQARLVYCETYCMRYCDLLLSPSQHMFDWAEANSITLAGNRRLIPYVIGDVVAAPGAKVEPDLDHLIFFGRLETRKGLHIFADALRLLKNTQPGDLPRKVSLLGKHAMVNGGSSAAFLGALAADLPEIEFAVLDNLDRLQAIDYIKRTRGLVVIPSILDNCPLTVIECIEHDLPFLAAATGGIPEMVDDEILFHPSASELGKRLSARRQLEYGNLAHKYSSGLARERWLGLHEHHQLTNGRAADTSQLRICVCIPFYNHGRYLKRLIESFQGQTYSSFEVVVIDDGSTGDSAIEFERVARGCGDSRFRFVSTSNQGPGATRNRAASMSGAEYLMFFDSDNLPKDETFMARLATAIKMSDADCITVPYDLVDEGCMEPAERDILSSYRPIGGCVEAGFFENVFGDTTMIVRRSVFDALGGFSRERNSWEDHEFLLKLCLKGYCLEVYPQGLLYYRISQNGRYRSSNHYRNFENLMAQLAQAPQPVLLDIVKNVALPTILEARR
jgi:glycosyltransferase involved in cell wall biosynthesis